MTYQVGRIVNKYGDRDYLQSWDQTWGTSCIGHPALAMQFDDKADAEAAAAKASKLVPTWTHSNEKIQWIVTNDREPNIHGTV